ncbi:MAG: MFS transporter [Kordiimonas sp.]|nr:MFS transporter [Kordiimonas sp.]|tara:strand:- start:3810 stop:5066 length:1257 start_codon:yes stop_codon:yes gene_type:complete
MWVFIKSAVANIARQNRIPLYSLPAIAFAIPMVPAFVLLPAFYAEDIGLGLTLTGGAFFIIRIVDMTSDPLVGWLTSTDHPVWGKKKIWIAIGSVIAGVSLWALFTPPPDANSRYLISWGCAMFIGWTMVQIPYLAWGLEIAPEYHQKTKLAAYREGATLLGILGALTLPVLLLTGDDRHNLVLIAAVALSIGFVGTLCALAFVPEGTTGRFQNYSLISLKKVAANRLLLRTITAWLLNGIGNGVPAVCFALYATYVLQISDAERNILLLVYFLTAVLSVPVWLYFSRRLGKVRAWCCGIILACVTFPAALFLGAGDFWFFFVVCVLTGFALGADSILPPAIQADVLDWDRLRYRRQIETIAFSLWTVSAKFSLALAAIVAFPLLDFLGLQEGAQAGLWGLKVIYALLPIVLRYWLSW